MLQRLLSVHHESTRQSKQFVEQFTWKLNSSEALLNCSKIDTIDFAQGFRIRNIHLCIFQSKWLIWNDYQEWVARIRLYTIVIRIIVCRNEQVRPGRDVSEFVVYADRVEFRHENHRGPIVYPITETLLCGISCVWAFDRTVSIRHSLWHRARAVDSGIFCPSPPFIYLSPTLPAPAHSPPDRCDSIFTSHNRCARAEPV